MHLAISKQCFQLIKCGFITAAAVTAGSNQDHYQGLKKPRRKKQPVALAADLSLDHFQG
jgi:hypothetical protein